MCEYCGCQAVEAIAVLTAEHDAVVTVIGRVRTALESRDLREAARQAVRIAGLLEPHTVVEERGLFPALADDFPEQVDRLVDQHRRIEEALDGARPVAAGEPPAPGWSARLTEAIYLLREHILAEQDGVFPAALAFLSPQQWADVDAIRAGVTPRP
jgi:hemerythrin-like domain-containing protein